MKVSIFRFSGLPVEMSDRDAYRDEFRRLYDKAEKIAGKDMLRLNKRLVTVEKALCKKYPTVVEVEFCETPEAWKQLMNKYGNILVSTNKNTGDLVFAIDDREEARY